MKFTHSFDFDRLDGLWRMFILPAIQQGRQRRDIQTSLAARIKGADRPLREKRKGNGEERNVGDLVGADTHTGCLCNGPYAKFYG